MQIFEKRVHFQMQTKSVLQSFSELIFFLAQMIIYNTAKQTNVPNKFYYTTDTGRQLDENRHNTGVVNR